MAACGLQQCDFSCREVKCLEYTNFDMALHCFQLNGEQSSYQVFNVKYIQKSRMPTCGWIVQYIPRLPTVIISNASDAELKMAFEDITNNRPQYTEIGQKCIENMSNLCVLQVEYLLMNCNCRPIKFDTKTSLDYTGAENYVAPPLKFVSVEETFQTINPITIIGRTYDLMSNIPDGLSVMKKAVEEHIYKQGMDALESCCETAINDPKLYFDTILDVHSQHHGLVSSTFKNDRSFLSALDKACDRFINTNAVTIARSNPLKSAELLARFSDILLKRSGRNWLDNELEEVLNNFLTVFKYIQDKDVFRALYRIMLAERLIQHTSASDEAELLMFSKLEQACNYEYTAKLRRMFQDIGKSKALNARYREHLNSLNVVADIDFNIKILSSRTWPFKQDCSSFSLPSELELSYQRFNDYFTSVHSGRKLNWLYLMCQGELETNYFKSRHIFQANIFQMAVLLQFNKKLRFSVQQIELNTGINQVQLIEIIKILLKSKIVASSDDESNISNTSVIELFAEYKNEKLRINIDIPLNNEQKFEEENATQAIEEYSIMKIRAAILRIMKTRKICQCQLLVSEVIVTLAPRFKAKIPLIIKCINKLIQMEYLQRHGRTYSYLM
ncbi:cullin-1-like [Bradysia coprophila]|uniref:cullin-1-like n=1 Tax=Bradysia coprophila TaxID=38358 RepID=UPI00187D7BBD|nr:cullin-1-like [Bradysia coprophila]